MHKCHAISDWEALKKNSQKSSIIFEIQRQENSLHKKKHGECFSQFEWNNGHAFIQDKIEILAPIKILLDSLQDENEKANNQSDDDEANWTSMKAKPRWLLV